jgi:hypothetical protein
MKGVAAAALVYCFHISLICVWQKPFGEKKQVGCLLQCWQWSIWPIGMMPHFPTWHVTKLQTFKGGKRCLWRGIIILKKFRSNSLQHTHSRHCQLLERG